MNSKCSFTFISTIKIDNSQQYAGCILKEMSEFDFIEKRTKGRIKESYSTSDD